MLNNCVTSAADNFLPNLQAEVGQVVGHSAQPLPTLPNLQAEVGQRFYSVKTASAQPAQPAQPLLRTRKYVGKTGFFRLFTYIFASHRKTGGQVGQVGQKLNVKKLGGIIE